MQQGGHLAVGAAWLGAAPVVLGGDCGWKSGDVKAGWDNAVILLEGSVSAQPVGQMSPLLAQLHAKPFRVPSLQSSPLISHIISLLCALTPRIICSGVVKKADSTLSCLRSWSFMARIHHKFLCVSFLSQKGECCLFLANSECLSISCFSAHVASPYLLDTESSAWAFSA